MRPAPARKLDGETAHATGGTVDEHGFTIAKVARSSRNNAPHAVCAATGTAAAVAREIVVGARHTVYEGTAASSE